MHSMRVTVAVAKLAGDLIAVNNSNTGDTMYSRSAERPGVTGVISTNASN